MASRAEPDSTRTVRIGGASGYWGDSQEAPRQLVLHGDVDYLVFDYLAEVTMSILVRAKEKSPDAGYARDFVDLVMAPLIHEIKARGIRVVVNAGGVNVTACAAALARVAEEARVRLRIGTVEGDVYRYEAPGMHALNFLLTRCLGGGGTSSLHLDTQAKTYAQQLLAMPVMVPRAVADEVDPGRPPGGDEVMPPRAGDDPR